MSDPVRPLRPLFCASCQAERPIDADPCPACGAPRWWHKTHDAAEFRERVDAQQAADAARFKPRDVR